MSEDRRSESRQNVKGYYTAEIRLVGVPLHEVKLKDLSSKGACIIFQDNSSLLNHLQIGKDLTVKYFLEDLQNLLRCFVLRSRILLKLRKVGLKFII